jgi:hypothetical protein
MLIERLITTLTCLCTKTVEHFTMVSILLNIMIASRDNLIQDHRRLLFK